MYDIHYIHIHFRKGLLRGQQAFQTRMDSDLQFCLSHKVAKIPNNLQFSVPFLLYLVDNISISSSCAADINPEVLRTFS